MFSDSSGVDVMKQMMIQRSRQHADRCNALLDQARMQMPGLPGIGQVRISGTDMFLDIIFDNVFTDVSWDLFEGVIILSRFGLANGVLFSASTFDSFDLPRSTLAKRFNVLGKKCRRISRTSVESGHGLR